MEYAKIQMRDMRSPAWLRASCTARGAAISLLSYCSEQENGGQFAAARSWGSAEWKQIAAISLAEVQKAVDSGLCFWDGDDLIVRLYDHKGHRELNTRRAQGLHGAKGAEFGHLGAAFGHLGGRPKTPRDNPPSEPAPIPSHSTHTIPVHTTPGEPSQDDITSPSIRPVIISDATRLGNLRRHRAFMRDDSDKAAWLGLLKDFGSDRVQMAVVAMHHANPGEAIFASDCQDALEAQAAEPAAPDAPKEPEWLTAARSLVRQRGWQACRDTIDVRCDSEASLLAILSQNRPACLELVTKIGNKACNVRPSIAGGV